MIQIKNRYTNEIIMGVETLKGSNLRQSNLSYTDLRGANLEDADLRDADLRNADIDNTCLWNTTGNGKEVVTLTLTPWIVNMTNHAIQIGCERHTYQEWKGFSDERIDYIDNKVLKFWTQNKETILNRYIEQFGEQS